MQVTIDSSEPLDKVLPVIAALYGVDLAASPRMPSPGSSDLLSTASRKGTRKTAAARKPVASTRSRRGKRQPDAFDVRSWARANGHDIKDRGRVPAAVLAAYLEQK